MKMLLNQIQEDLKTAQLAKDETKVSTLRLLLSEIHNFEIVLRQSSGQAISDEQIISVIQREVKKRREAAEAFRSGGREVNAQKEEAEMAVLQTYLPAQLSNEELTSIVETSINEVGASSMADMGKVIGAVMGKVKGQADGGTVSALVKERLSS